MTHKLKILPEYFEAVTSGEKTFEVRKDDRPFKVGDVLRLREFDGQKLTGEEVVVKVSYILRGAEYCKDGYCILGIKRLGRWETVEDYDGDEHFRCSACGVEWYLEAGNPKDNGMKYCPSCGYRLVQTGRRC